MADAPRHGAHVVPGGTEFTLWAPLAERVELEVDGGAGPARCALARAEQHDGPHAGWWSVTVPGTGHGTRYRYVLDSATAVADPASAWQPDGIAGPSAVVDPAGFGADHAWTDTGWRGVELRDAVIYEVHVGTFTRGGTFDAAIAELDRLATLGITVVEVMPVAAFPGMRNWGYDGVFPYAVQDSYGGPAALARFVDAAHARGIAVLLDVVYNHVGPEGSVHRDVGPYFTDAYRNPWGDAVNVSEAGSDAVRAYFVQNAARWIRDFHLDGLRLDAVHSLTDPTANPFWAQIAGAVHAAGAATRRRTIVVGESDLHDPRTLHDRDRGGWGFDAVWMDDVRHTVGVATLGERHDHLVDYEGTAAELADTVAHRWRFRGQWSPARRRSHGAPVDDVSPRRFVVCFENHDQVGNRPAGDRVLRHTAARRLASTATILLPSTPLLFMGEEHADPAPFPFFVDHEDPELLDAVRRGRRAEFAGADWSGEVPDPADPTTFERAVIDPSLARTEPHRSVLAMYTELLRLRREVGPVTADATQEVLADGDVVVVDRRAGDERAVLCLNLGATPTTTGVVDLTGLSLAFDASDARWGGDGPTARLTAGAVELPPWGAVLLVS